MKRKSTGTVAFWSIGFVVVGLSLAAGYYLVGNRGSNSPAPPVTAPPPAPAAETGPNPAPVQPRQIANAGKYTAPGAPTVTIAEIKSSQVPEKTESDPEQSQTGATVPPPASTGASLSTPASSTASSTISSPTTDPGPTPPPPSDDATPIAPSVVNPSAQSNLPSSAANSATTVANSSLYCVEAGTFASVKNAKSLVDNLRALGYDAAVIAGDSTNSSFRVQVGAYRTKGTADDAVTNLQHQGYPAYILTK